MPPKWTGPISELFATHCSEPDGNGCVKWLAFRNRRGYGKFQVARRAILAHRFAYREAYGPIPEGLVIDHLCRNPSCVNPAHLEAVTQSENVRRGLAPQRTREWNALRTHCKRGHALEGRNLRLVEGGRRQCRACAVMHNRNARDRKKASR